VLRSSLLLAALGLACASAPPRLRPPPEIAATPVPAPVSAARLAPPGDGLGPGSRSIVPAAEPPPAPHSFLVSRERTRVVVLLYHAFDVGPDPLGLPASRFVHHLDALTSLGVEFVPLSALIDFLEGKRELGERAAVITIDDGHRSVYKKAWPILRERRLPFTLGLPTAFIDQPGQVTLSWEQIREMLASGLCELASHGHRHRRLGPLDARRTREELELSREIIERETGA
jgi:hypothetical protein